MQVGGHGQYHEEKLPPQRDTVEVQPADQGGFRDHRQYHAVPHLVDTTDRSLASRIAAVAAPAAATTAKVIVIGAAK